jgi:integrase
MLGKITKVSVERLQQNQVLWDTALVGLGARRQLRHVHYLLRYRFKRKQRFLSIGRHGMWTPDTARTEAKRLLGLIATGADPASRHLHTTETFGTEITRYLAVKSTAVKTRSIVEINRHLQVYAKPLHSMPLDKIDRRTIALRLSEIEQTSGGVSRNRFRSSLSAFFAWAIREGLTEFNPVSGTGKFSEGNGRDRVLTQTELTQLLGALGENDFSDIIRLLVLTGMRRDEVGGLRWSEIDWQRKLIALPADRTKNRRNHELPMSRQVDAVLGRRRAQQHPRYGGAGGEFVFGQRFTGWSVCKANLDKRLNGVAKWTLHDLRRSAATHMAELGAMPHVVEAVLNHQSGHRAGVAGIYNRARYADEMRAALQQWGDFVDRLVNN